LALVIVLAIAAGVGWLYFRDAASRQPEAGPSSVSTPTYDAVRRGLEELPVKGWDRVKDFNRARFGEPWSDDVNVEFGHNGCNTRDDILRRDLVDLQVRPGTCFAQRGILHDPYTGATIVFVRGPDTSPAVQIDHIVSAAPTTQAAICTAHDVDDMPLSGIGQLAASALGERAAHLDMS
jgi:hypothetical protein